MQTEMKKVMLEEGNEQRNPGNPKLAGGKRCVGDSM